MLSHHRQHTSDIAGWIEIVRRPYMLDVQTHKGLLGHNSHICGDVQGLVIYLERLGKNPLIQTQLSDEFLRSGVLSLQRLKLPGLTRLQAAVLLAPKVIRLLNHAQLTTSICNSRPLSQGNISFSEFDNNLFRGVWFDGHLLSPSWPIHLTFDMDQCSRGQVITFSKPLNF